MLSQHEYGCQQANTVPRSGKIDFPGFAAIVMGSATLIMLLLCGSITAQSGSACHRQGLP
jgi:hypothetical protein